MPENITYFPDHLLCKSKSLQTGQWVTGYFLQTQKNKEHHTYIIVDEIISPELPARQNKIEIHPESICRHTGYCKNGVDIWEKDQITDSHRHNLGVIRFGSYANICDSPKTEHDGFYVDWGKNDMLRKDLGYWINVLSDEDNVISQNKISVL